MNLLVFAGLSDEKLQSKLLPLIHLKKVKNIYLIRNNELRSPKVISIKSPRILNFVGAREIMKFLMGVRACRKKKIDLIIGIFLRPHSIYVYLLGKIFRKRVIYLLIGNDVDFIIKHSKIFSRFLNQAESIGVRGPRSMARLKNISSHPKHYFIHHNVFSPEDNLHSDSHTTPLIPNIDILTIGDFSRVKRIDIFLKVITAVKKTNPEIQAVMLGGGKQKPWYVFLKKKMGLNKNVQFLGIVPDVKPFLQKCRVFLLTSEAEGLPMVMIEAMTQGNACVVPDVGDITSIAENNKNALVVSRLDVDGFVSGVKTILKDRKLAEHLGKNAIATITSKKREFSVEYNMQLWEKILD